MCARRRRLLGLPRRWALASVTEISSQFRGTVGSLVVGSNRADGLGFRHLGARRHRFPTRDRSVTRVLGAC
jgi:hypothetical protein